MFKLTGDGEVPFWWKIDILGSKLSFWVYNRLFRGMEGPTLARRAIAVSFVFSTFAHFWNEHWTTGLLWTVWWVLLTYRLALRDIKRMARVRQRLLDGDGDGSEFVQTIIDFHLMRTVYTTFVILSTIYTMLVPRLDNATITASIACLAFAYYVALSGGSGRKKWLETAKNKIKELVERMKDSIPQLIPSPVPVRN